MVEARIAQRLRALVGRRRHPDRGRDTADEALRRAERRLRASFDDAPIGMTVVDLRGRFVEANEAFCEIVGRPADELHALTWADITHPDDVAEDAGQVQELLAGTTRRYQMRKRYLRPDGTVVPVRLSVTMICDDADRPDHFVAQVVDLSETSDAVQAADRSEQRLSAIYGASPIGIALLDDDGTVTDANPALRAMLEDLDPTGGVLPALCHPDDAGYLADALARGMSCEVRLFGSLDGHTVQVHAAALPGGGHIAQVIDVTAESAQRARLIELAHTDSLTGLLNRRTFTEQVTAAIITDPGIGGVVLLLDLDGFKGINDSLGHAAGDATLIEIASALRAVVPSGAPISRLGGDEFAVLLEARDLRAARRIAGNVLATLRHRRSMDPAGMPVVTASIGLAAFGSDPTLTADDLLTRADLAMYDAKDAGRNRAAVFDPTSGRREATALRQGWIDRIRDHGDRLVVLGQPIVPLQGGAATPRFELLTRYRHPDGTLEPPASFLHIAEQVGLVGDIDRHVLRTAAALILRHLGPVQLAVNVSAQTLADPDLHRFLDRVIGPRPLPDGSLLIEITETAALSTVESLGDIAATLRARGCLLAIDDFGSGFATFHYLRDLDVDVLKIDGRFVREIDTSAADRLIVESILGLAAGLGLPVIAEHVETPAVAQLLTRMGVQFAQGYLFGEPAPIEDLLGNTASGMR